MSSRLRPQVLLGHLSSPLPRSQLYADKATESQRSQMPSGSRPGTPISHLSSLFRSPPNIDEAIEHQHCPGSATSSHLNLHVVDVAVMRDREVCFSCMCCNCWVQRFLCRSYLLLVGPTLLVIMKWPSASKTPNRGFTWCCFSAACLLVPMRVLAPIPLVAAHSQLVYFHFVTISFSDYPITNCIRCYVFSCVSTPAHISVRIPVNSHATLLHPT
jgi:hypothetical protein